MFKSLHADFKPFQITADRFKSFLSFQCTCVTCHISFKAFISHHFMPFHIATSHFMSNSSHSMSSQLSLYETYSTSLPQPNNCQVVQKNGKKHARAEAYSELLDFVPIRWQPSGKIVHYCHHGCGCTSEDHALNRLLGILDNAYFCTSITVPALNRWNTILAPLLWFLFGHLFFGILP